MLAPETGDANQAGAAHQHGQGDQSDHRRQRMNLSARTARIGQFREGFQQRAGTHGHQPGNLEDHLLYPIKPNSTSSNREWPCGTWEAPISSH